MQFDLLVNPAAKLGHIGVHARGVLLSAADAPVDDAGLLEPMGIASERAGKWGAAVALARVLAPLAASTHHAVMELKVLAVMATELRLAGLEAHNRQVNLLHDVREGVFLHGRLAPAADDAPRPVEVLVSRRQANGSDVARSLDRFLEEQQGQIVGSRSPDKRRMEDDLPDCNVHMTEPLRLGGEVPFASPHQDLIAIHVANDVVSGEHHI